MIEEKERPPVNPLLERLRMPGATFRLPSQGIFYTKGELAADVKNGEVEVYPMTAMEEIILSTPDKLLSGKAITEVFGRCIPQILKPYDLLTKDVDYLMVCLRMTSFGQEMDVTSNHYCMDGSLDNKYTVDLDKMLRGTKQIDPTTIGTEYSHTLPNGQVATLKPLTYSNVIELYQTTAMDSENMSIEDTERLVVNTLASVISRVEDVEDPEFIREWVTKLPLGWKKSLETAAQSVSQWGIDFVSKHTCKDCKKQMDIRVTANPVSFFT